MGGTADAFLDSAFFTQSLEREFPAAFVVARDGIVVSADAKVCELFGRPEVALKGCPLTDFAASAIKEPAFWLPNPAGIASSSREIVVKRPSGLELSMAYVSIADPASREFVIRLGNNSATRFEPQ